MSGNDRSPQEESSTPTRIKFDYLKSNFFRVVHADGVIGGLTPTLDIHMDVWSQRMPIPRAVVHKVLDDGTLGEEIKDEREVREAVVREVEVGVVLSRALAQKLIEWLQDKVKQVDEHLAKKDGGNGAD